MDISKIVRDIPDFPIKGIVFKDITPVLSDSEAFNEDIKKMEEQIDFTKVDKIAGIESRGFIFGGVLAYKHSKSFIPVRKKGKLPYTTPEETYALEYGEATIEIHTDAVNKGDRILLVDDLLATGGTMKAAASLIERAGGIVQGMLFLIELDFLNGRKKVEKYKISSIIHY
ncbi:MAG: adenine phosphoribosyltransferase [bacterium]|nr:adenine phosphoribosyltransferase [bacterium]